MRLYPIFFSKSGIKMINLIPRLWWKATFAFLTVVVFVASASAGPVILGGDDLTDHGLRLSVAPGPGSGVVVPEIESNDSFAVANSFAIGDDYTGTISPANESDFVSFPGTAGQTIIATTVLGTLSDSTLRLLDTDGVTELAFNDDFVGLASQIVFTLSTDGTYFLEVQSFDVSCCSGTYTLELRAQLGGDTLADGWLYIQKALENLAPSVTRAGNDGSVAVLGSADSTATTRNAGAAYHFAVPNAAATTSLTGTVTFHNGATAINLFFTDLAAGTVNPAIIVTAGTDAQNDLDSSEGAALTSNATNIANFVNSGGGLLSHGFGTTAYGWLTALIPGASFPSGCQSSTLSLTTLGQLAFPGLTNTNIRSGPCHNHFQNHGLPVLARDTSGLTLTLSPASGVSVAEAEANNTSGSADSFGIGDDYTGSISPGGESDYVSFTATAGQTIVAETVLGSLSDSTLTLYDTDGTTQLVFNDDGGPGLASSRIVFTLQAAGTYFLEVRASGNSQTGSYTLQLRNVLGSIVGRDVIIGGGNITLPGQITLTPAVDFNPPGTSHTVTANVVDTPAGNPLQGESVSFDVLSGPNSGETGNDTTDANGDASFSYTDGNINTGLDEIAASFVDGNGNTVVNTARKYWDLDCQPNNIPDSCDISCAAFNNACAADFPGCGGSTDANNDGVPDECNNPPVAQCQDVQVPADGSCQASASVDGGSFDPDGDPITLSPSPAGPYPLGQTQVTLTVFDGQATNQCVATVTVVDVTNPVISCPADITVDNDPGQGGAVVNFTTATTDNCDSNVAVVCTPASGSTFPVGTTGVNCTATDDAGNQASCSFGVTVVPNLVCELKVKDGIAESLHLETFRTDPNLADTWQVLFAAAPGVSSGNLLTLQDDRAVTWEAGTLVMGGVMKLDVKTARKTGLQKVKITKAGKKDGTTTFVSGHGGLNPNLADGGWHEVKVKNMANVTVTFGSDPVTGFLKELKVKLDKESTTGTPVVKGFKIDITGVTTAADVKKGTVASVEVTIPETTVTALAGTVYDEKIKEKPEVLGGHTEAEFERTENAVTEGVDITTLSDGFNDQLKERKGSCSVGP